MSAHFFKGFRPYYLKGISQLAERLLIMPNTYKEAIEALNKLQSNAEYIKRAKIKNNQEHNMVEMAKFLNRSGLPLDQLDTLPIIHVAGTNGKGTTCSYCESILRSHGYKTGFYSSPHLLEVRERIRLNGVPISREKFARHFHKIYNSLDKHKNFTYDMPLYFRFLTILAFHIFIAERVDVAILEVGIGGEYDCTNVVRNTVVAGITPLDIDHTALLGTTIESIAWNKAGIMKPGAQIFTAPQPESAMAVLEQRSIERSCTLKVVEDLYSDGSKSVIPKHIQRTNASMALAISKAFMDLRPRNSNKNILNKEFDLELAKQAIEATRWPGRYEIRSRKNALFYLDGAHTIESMQVCSDWFLSKAAEENRPKVLIFNVTGERNPESLLKLLVKCKFSIVLFTPNVGDDNDSADLEDNIQPVNSQLERCYKNKAVWEQLNGNCAQSGVFPSVAKALRFLESHNNGDYNVLVTGSIHLIGAAMAVLDPTLGGLL